MELVIHPTARPHYDRLSSDRTVSLLLHGVAGVGLTTMARELVRRMLCSGCTAQTCGDCVRLRAGSHGRYIEILPDDKGKIGIDSVISLRHALSLQQQSNAAQAVIVDGADTMTLAAQNALLKTLEEPPDGTTIILTANAPDLLLPTIRSRVQAQYFPVPPPEDVANFIARTRGVESSEAIELAKLAQGLPAIALRLQEDPSLRERMEIAESYLAKLTTPNLYNRLTAAMEIAKDTPVLTLLLQALPSWAHGELRRTHDPRITAATLHIQERLRANISAKTALEAFAVELPC